jgi:hypothetical protein
MVTERQSSEDPLVLLHNDGKKTAGDEQSGCQQSRI